MVKGSKSYSNSKIYKLVDPNGYYYIGSTTTELSKRKSKHKYEATRCPYQKVYAHFNNIGWNKIRIVLIKDNLNVENIEQLLQVEDTYIINALDDDHCLNHQRAWTGLTKDEYKRQYYLDHREQILDRQTQTILCQCCECSVTKTHFPRHCRSINHITNFILY